MDLPLAVSVLETAAYNIMSALQINNTTQCIHQLPNNDAVFIPCGLFGPADVIQVLRIVQGIAAMFQLNTKDFFGIRGPNATDTSTQSPNSTSPTQAVLTVDGKWSIIDSVYFLFRDSNSFTGCKNIVLFNMTGTDQGNELCLTMNTEANYTLQGDLNRTVVYPAHFSQCTDAKNQALTLNLTNHDTITFNGTISINGTAAIHI